MISHDIIDMVITAIARNNFDVLERKLRGKESASGKVILGFPKKKRKCIIHYDTLGDSTSIYWRSFLWFKKELKIDVTPELKSALELITIEQLTPLATNENDTEREKLSKLERKFRQHFS